MIKIALALLLAACGTDAPPPPACSDVCPDAALLCTRAGDCTCPSTRESCVRDLEAPDAGIAP